MRLQQERERVLNARYRRASRQKGYRALRLQRELDRFASAGRVDV